MLKTILCLAVFFACGVLYAQPPAGAAKKGEIYGKKITATNAITLKELESQLAKQETVTAKIKGTVKEVCSKKGCWVTMELPDKTQMMVKFKDYAFFVPTALSGKTVVLDGTARRKIVSVNELKHFAEDAKKPQAEIDAITQPEKQVKFEATGVLVM